MRCKNIKVKLSIPVPIDKPDGNGNMYSEDAIIKACENANDLPIVQLDNKANHVVIGVVNNVEYINGTIEVEGCLWHGGTCELVSGVENGILTDMTTTSFELCL